ncbi:MAG: tyrosine-type recombinase/integrase [Eggerthellaceae bacterium]|nr:tyrosine-type recombinase/integrase [Eggerthellaceae bacterium]
MATQEEHVGMFKAFIDDNGNSENVCNLYWKRVRTFLSKHPEAMELGKEELRELVEEYIGEVPVTSGIGVTATAVRYYWTMRFGERWCNRFDFADYAEDEGIEQECAKFRAFLESLGTLSATTVRDRVQKVRQFLYAEFCGDFSRDKVCAESVSSYVSGGLSGKSAPTRRGFCTEVRSYARFLVSEGYSETAGPVAELTFTGPAVADKLPACMPASDYATVRESIDTSTTRGKRDLAMLLLMGNLGLRQSDVALLDLGDVDWANGVLRVRDSKSISDRSIPLDEGTGSALQDYVVNGRPRAASRSLFLPCGNEAPGELMGFGQVGGAIELAAQKAGVMLRGTHSLRRAVVSAMVNGGVPIKFVADVLGYESVKTTMGYLRVDAERLRKAASPWPGEVTS